MCLFVYIAAAKPLEIIPWDIDKPAFCVTELPDEISIVRRQFDVPYVYCADSHESCGCGFQFGEYPEYEDEERHFKRESLDKFCAYLKKQLEKVQKIDLYACWDGDEAVAPIDRALVSPDVLRSHKFYFQKNELLQFDLAAAPAVILTDPMQDAAAAWERGERDEAFCLWQPQADLGNALAQAHVGSMFKHEGNYDEASKWLLRAADQGNALAQFELGELYEYGTGVQQDLLLAYKWFALAAREEHDNDQALINLSKKMKPNEIAEAKRLVADWKSRPAEFSPWLPFWPTDSDHA